MEVFGLILLVLALVLAAMLIAVYWSYVMLCIEVFNFVLEPLLVPGYSIERRERRMEFVLFFCMPLLWIGALLVFFANLVWLYENYQGEPPGPNKGKYWLPIIPKIALSELLAMVFSVACVPIVTGLLLRWIKIERGQIPDSVREMNTNVLGISIVVLLTFIPLSFSSAFHRLDGNRVTLGAVRLALLFIYPYLTFAMPPAVIGLFVVPSKLILAVGRMDLDLAADVPFYMAAWAILGLGAWLARKAPRLGPPPEAMFL